MSATEIGDFFDQIWKDTEGAVYLPVKTTDGFKKFMFPWPQKRDLVIKHVLKFSADVSSEVFFSPAIYKARKPTAENVLGAWVAWADFDGNAPDKWPTDIAPLPTIEVQSSVKGKKHVYWELKEFTGPKKLQDMNRAIAYAMQADLSGWDANQFLRPPSSVNRKYAKPIKVEILRNRLDRIYRTEDFSNIPTPKEAIRASVDVDDLPDIEEVLAEARWDAELLSLFRTTGDDMQHEGRDRSGALQRLAYEGAEHGWTDQQIMAVLLDADERWGKYVGRRNRNKILVDLVNRARAKVGYNSEAEVLGLADKFLSLSAEVEAEDENKVFYTPFELATMSKDIDWFVDGLLPNKGIGLFTGRAGVGKTQLALQLAADLSTGKKKFLGRDLPGNPRKVLMLSLEMNEYQLPIIMRPLVERYPDLQAKDNIMIYARGEMLPLETEAGQAYFTSMLEEFKPDLVIADSLSFMSSADISSDSDMKTLFGFLQRSRKQYEYSMVIIHHHRKKANDAQSKKTADTLADVYGSYIVTSTVDFVLNLEERPDDAEEKQLTLSMLKSRYSAIPEPAKVARNDKLHFSVLEDLANKFMGGEPLNVENTGLTI